MTTVGSLGVLRAVAQIAAVAGGVGSVVLLLQAGRRNGSLVLLMVLFTIWVLAPFAAMLWANMVSTRWSAATRVTLACVSLALVLCSLAAYGGVLHLGPAGAPTAFPFVIVPPVSVILMAIIVSMAAFISRKQ